ncbi:MAG: hypothetical protein KAJ66_03710 [Candidatus Omnitrophica bacterium]|nr:hypothetical protein [Candidatus Omnitrophota bacterium]
MLSQKYKNDTKLLRKLILLIGGLLLFEEGLNWLTLSLNLDVRFYLWFTFIAVSIVVIIVISVLYRAYRRCSSIVKGLENLNQKQKRYLKRARKHRILLLIIGILIFVGVHYYTLICISSLSFLDVKFHTWFLPIILGTILGLISCWEDPEWLNIVDNLGKLSQKQKRYIQRYRKFLILPLIVGIISIVSGVQFALQTHKISSILDIKIYQVPTFFLIPRSVAFAIFALVGWYYFYSALKIVQRVKSRLDYTNNGVTHKHINRGTL